MKSKIEEMQTAFQTAFIDKNVNSNLAYRPQFVSNNYKEGKKVLSVVEEELLQCNKFFISVAFITMSGVAPLLQTLKELETKGIKGKILTTDYLYFSEPSALEKLQSLKNIELKMYCTKNKSEGFHTKGYIFEKDEIYKIIVGSSNITEGALTKNREWNSKIISTDQGEYAVQIIKEFEEFFHAEQTKKFDDFIEEYRLNYEIIKQQKQIAKNAKVPSFEQYRLQPNKMQLKFVKNLKHIQESGQDKALLISATGTGKTYASAFAVREFNPRKVLFMVHREQIARQAMESFKKVFGNTKQMNVLSGNSKEYEADFLFATMQTMAKAETMERYQKDEFEFIVIDEVHHAGAESYQKIIKYFKPRFWLGMTASPERTDNFDIYEVFDHNVAYEIRLQKALEEDLLCTFHYFGITEVEINGEVFDEMAETNRFADLVSDKRIDYIIEKAEYYGYSGQRVKGLIFCRTKEEGRELSYQFNEKNFKTLFLCGEDSEDVRQDAIDRLINDEREDRIDYIFTIEIFNEGVDIPEINQVIMLRPTKSPIVFIQQLGRGLRKAEGKEYVVILDFIGNYKNNFMIPIALSGDRTYNKDSIRKYVSNGSRMLPGASTIHFDEIARERIYQSIDEIKGIKKIIRESYKKLKNRLGRVPNILDFYENGEVDPIIILDNYKSYYQFLNEIEKSESYLSNTEIKTLEYFSKTIARGKRPHELVILDYIMRTENIEIGLVKDTIKETYGLEASEDEIKSAIWVLEGKFGSNNAEREKYKDISIIQEANSNFYTRMISFSDKLKNSDFKQQIKELLILGTRRYQDIYNDLVARRGEFILFQKYSRRDVCYLLNWGKDYSATMYGMKRVKEDVALFITYHKKCTESGEEYVDGKPNYADEFVNNQIFNWESQIGKGPESSYIKDVKEAERKHLFIKKNDAEGADYYYMGQFEIVSIFPDKKKNNKGKMQDISKVQLKMKDPVREDLLEYLRKGYN